MGPIDWKTALKYANLVNIAYSVAPNAEYSPPALAAIRTAGYTYQQTIYGDDLATDIDPHLGDVVTFGFLATSADGELVAAVRGTETIWEWIHDASFLMVPCCVSKGQGMSEDGFSGVYESLRIGRANGTMSATTSIANTLSGGTVKSVTITGHSLGGALAHLLALDVALNTVCRNPTVYTYASPRVGDHLFATGYNATVPNTCRIANRQDLVPQLPPILPLPYEHVNTKFELNPPPNAIAGTIACMHILSSYMWLMDQLAGTNTWPLTQSCRAMAPGPTLGAT